MRRQRHASQSHSRVHVRLGLFSLLPPSIVLRIRGLLRGDHAFLVKLPFPLRQQARVRRIGPVFSGQPLVAVHLGGALRAQFSGRKNF